MAGRVEEGDPPSVDLGLIRADVLRDPACLGLDNRGLADRVEKRRLPVVVPTLLTPKIDLTAIAKLLRFQVSSLCVSLRYCVKFLAIPKVSVLALCWPQAGDIAVADTKPTPDRSVLFIIGRKSDRSRQRQKNLK